MKSSGTMKQVGVYGGSFSPIHNGHVQLTKHVLRPSALGEIWFMVSPQNPLKLQNELLDDHLRLEMTRTALQNEPKLIAYDTEFHLSKPSYTWNTLRHLSTEYLEISFTFIIGADNWLIFNQRTHYEDILRNYEIIIYPRRNAPINKQSLPHNARLLNTPLYNISNIEVRRRIRQGEDVNQLIPPKIIPLATRYYPYP